MIFSFYHSQLIFWIWEWKKEIKNSIENIECLRKSFQRYVSFLFRNFQVRKLIVVLWFYSADVLESFWKKMFFEKIWRGFQVIRLPWSPLRKWWKSLKPPKNLYYWQQRTVEILLFEYSFVHCMLDRIDTKEQETDRGQPACKANISSCIPRAY